MDFEIFVLNVDYFNSFYLKKNILTPYGCIRNSGTLSVFSIYFIALATPNIRYIFT